MNENISKLNINYKVNKKLKFINICDINSKRFCSTDTARLNTYLSEIYKDRYKKDTANSRKLNLKTKTPLKNITLKVLLN